MLNFENYTWQLCFFIHYISYSTELVSLSILVFMRDNTFFPI